jgi:hypothetical protein
MLRRQKVIYTPYSLEGITMYDEQSFDISDELYGYYAEGEDFEEDSDALYSFQNSAFGPDSQKDVFEDYDDIDPLLRQLGL